MRKTRHETGKVLELAFREVDQDKFQAIVAGIKRYESRAGSREYEAIHTGDHILFRCGEQTCLRRVTQVFHFPTIDTMLTNIPLQGILPGVTTVDEAKSIYQSFPGYTERIAKDGILVFELSD